MPPKSRLQAEHDFAAFLQDPTHQKRLKPDKPDAVDEEAVGEAPEWHAQGKPHPDGWRQVGDGDDATFVED